jgi:isoleucyl-tRNA synthetase
MNGDNKNKSEAALREEKILEFWRENKTFEKSLQKKAPKGHYVFYDGPPFATGQIHYGHILGSTAKDVIGRYQTMQGHYVPRKWGWDCHGLPIENIVEKDLKIAGHKEIENYGIDKFVEYARSKVLQYDADWRKGIERIGRWVDFDKGYKTMDNTFIESVWWALGELHKQKLIYEGVKVLAYCARCETPIANSEIAMDNSYKDIADISIYVKFELADEQGTYLLAWTTTPWTLPGNTAIAVNKNITYVKVADASGGKYILAKEALEKLKDKFQGEAKILEEFTGEKLFGLRYKPVFPYYLDANLPNKENIWKVWHGDFVTTEMGTGLAHEAPAFGEDDMILAKANNIPWIIHVDETGRFKKEVKDFAGLKVKPKDTEEDKDAHLRTDIEVIKYLQEKGSYFAKEKIMHSYPHCMRCDTPIIYYALRSWFIDIQKNKKQNLKNAEFMHWVPEHLKEGRFKNIMESAPDWNISRNRFWASPLPIWKCEKCESLTFVSSLEDLKNKSIDPNNALPLNHKGELDLHRPYIDKIKLKCSCSGEMTRIPEVLDCWFESGSMPFAQDHYPFENPNWKKNNFPAGFVAEYIAQTRTWFYYTHIVSSLLFNHAPFKNVVTTGTLRAEDGQKMSKSKNNYPDPWAFIDKYSADALRIYLMSSSLMKGEDANFSEKAVQEVSNKFLSRLYNVLAFYELYPAETMVLSKVGDSRPPSKNILDKWILNRLEDTIEESTKEMENYNMALAIKPIEIFIEDLSTWYLRRSRERIKAGDAEAKVTLYFVLKTLTKIIAPFAPFAAEDIWQKLKKEGDEESVHLSVWPRRTFRIFSMGAKTLSSSMEEARKIVTLGLEARQRAGIKVRQALQELKVKSLKLKDQYLEIVKEELNVKNIVEDMKIAGEILLDLQITPELKAEGDYRELVRALQDIRKKNSLKPTDEVNLSIATDEAGKNLIKEFETDLKKVVLVREIKFIENDGEEIEIDNMSFRVTIEK